MHVKPQPVFVCLFFKDKLGYQNMYAAGVPLECENSNMTSKTKVKNKTEVESKEFLTKINK